MSKYKLDFVTNSSSTSYICEISGERESGMDADAEDLGFYLCSNGHEYLEKYRLDHKKYLMKEKVLEWIEKRIKSDPCDGDRKKELTKWKDEIAKEGLNECLAKEISESRQFNCETGGHLISSSLCPICQMEYIRDKDMLKFFLKLNGKREDVVKLMKAQYPTYEDMRRDLDG
jgi:hypothetical protein